MLSDTLTEPDLGTASPNFRLASHARRERLHAPTLCLHCRMLAYSGGTPRAHMFRVLRRIVPTPTPCEVLCFRIYNIKLSNSPTFRIRNEYFIIYELHSSIKHVILTKKCRILNMRLGGYETDSRRTSRDFSKASFGICKHTSGGNSRWTQAPSYRRKD